MKKDNYEVNRLYAYIMTSDTGFAPNPFHGVCTLACCKPRIRKSIAKYAISEKEKCSELQIKDMNIWIVGLAGKYLAKDASKKNRQSIIYVMKISTIMKFSEYWNCKDKRIKKKNPGNASDYFRCIHSLKELAEFAEENSLIKACGDNIYEEEKEDFYKNNAPLQSFHHIDGKANGNNIRIDLSCEYVLLSDTFVYFGKEAEYPSELMETFPEIRRGHRVFYRRNPSKDSKQENDNPTILAFEKFLNENVTNFEKQLIGPPIHSSIVI